MAHGTARPSVPPINPKDFTDAAGRAVDAVTSKTGGASK